ncbi:hypothetical protein BOTBODRAFT_32962 [Botryobasidium botryosum FD-172 SS1]|uniref:F-box domain-containing protein n=1 Tax=Botryobasidium botryosum (strain FD-172 SS1) TaxID=930990 RepID=A0A067MRF2_BOTB1|nr:hypothetical protein BOTBODRAFT_32962 [Botryobasidium botryosum FD-172 SS1]
MDTPVFRVQRLRACERLPLEVLQDIFFLCVEANGTNALILSLVSRKWRATAYCQWAAWRMWSRVDANLASSSAVEKIAHSLVLWSTPRPLPDSALLHVTIARNPPTSYAPPNVPTIDMVALISLVQAFSTRWLSFYISSNLHDAHAFFRALPLNPHPTPRLESLHIEGFCWTQSSIHEIASILRASPLLKSVYLGGATSKKARAPLTTTIVLPNVIHFCTKGAGAASLLEKILLPECAELAIHGTYDNILNRLLAASPKVQRAVIDHLVYRENNGPFVIPTSISNTIKTLEIFSPCLTWLRHHGFPNLQSLTIHTGAKVHPYIGAALQRSFKLMRPPLLSLSLEKVNMSDYVTNQILEYELPRLETLEVVQCTFSHLTLETLRNPHALRFLSRLVINRCAPISPSEILEVLASRRVTSTRRNGGLSGEIVFAAADAPSQMETDTIEVIRSDIVLLKS